MQYFITGATGLVGSHLTFRLLQEPGAKVHVLHRAGSDLAFIKKVFAYYHPKPELLYERIAWHEVDLLDSLEIESVLSPGATVFHCAAKVSFNPRDRKTLLEDNPKMTAEMVNASLASGVKRFIHLSSVAALGRKEGQSEFNEKSDWVESKRNSNYAKGKYASELEVWRGMEEGLSAAILNPTIILGPGVWQQGSSKIFESIAQGFSFYSEGVNGFVDVRDVAEIAFQLSENEKQERYVVSAENRSYKEVFFMIADALGVKRPTRKITPFLSNIAWRWEWLKSKLTGKAPLVTKETAATALDQNYYQNHKVREELNFQFRPLAKSIIEIASFYQQDAPQ